MFVLINEFAAVIKVILIFEMYFLSLYGRLPTSVDA
jgi:hypothetical protein